MRKAVFLAALVAATAMPASAHTVVDITHRAPVPCTLVCPYYGAGEAAGFDACSRPAPLGSYDRTVLTFTPDPGFITIDATSEIDYDTFVCTTTNPSREIPFRGGLPEECAGLLDRPVVPVGCTETGVITRNALHAVNGGANDSFVIVSYNWADVGSVEIRLTGPVAVVDDTFEPVIL